MEFIRKVVSGNDLRDIADIPNSMLNKKVEIFIFPVDSSKKEKTNSKKSLAGKLAKYANSKLIDKEKEAWYLEAKE